MVGLRSVCPSFGPFAWPAFKTYLADETERFSVVLKNFSDTEPEFVRHETAVLCRENYSLYGRELSFSPEKPFLSRPLFSLFLRSCLKDAGGLHASDPPTTKKSMPFCWLHCPSLHGHSSPTKKACAPTGVHAFAFICFPTRPELSAEVIVVEHFHRNAQTIQHVLDSL